MSVCLCGWVECRQEGKWSPLIRVGADLVPNDQDLFGSLFGISNFASFEPLFAARGLPQDLSEETAALALAAEQYNYGDAFPEIMRGVAQGLAYTVMLASDADYFGHTWVTLRELLAIDWSEKAMEPDRRIQHIEVSANGSERRIKKAEASLESAPFLTEINAVGEVRSGNRIFRRATMTRADTSAALELLLRVMDPLGQRFGDQHVRLVVWFIR